MTTNTKTSNIFTISVSGSGSFQGPTGPAGARGAIGSSPTGPVSIGSASVIGATGTIGWGHNSWYNPPKITTNDGDIILERPDKTNIKIGETLDSICDLLNIIVPNNKLINDNPALKSAYEDYKQTLGKIIINQELKSAYDNYKIMENLVCEQKDDTHG